VLSYEDEEDQAVVEALGWLRIVRRRQLYKVLRNDDKLWRHWTTRYKKA
jgi:hypothetical protein